MIIPIRCFTCGKPISHLYEKYLKMIEEDYYKNDSKEIKRFIDIETLENEKEKSPECKALDELGLTRYCCRRMFLGCVDLTDSI